MHRAARSGDSLDGTCCAYGDAKPLAARTSSASLTPAWQPPPRSRRDESATAFAVLRRLIPATAGNVVSASPLSSFRRGFARWHETQRPEGRIAGSASAPRGAGLKCPRPHPLATRTAPAPGRPALPSEPSRGDGSPRRRFPHERWPNRKPHCLPQRIASQPFTATWIACGLCRFPLAGSPNRDSPTEFAPADSSRRSKRDSAVPRN